jgi:hypothetical protein
LAARGQWRRGNSKPVKWRPVTERFADMQACYRIHRSSDGSDKPKKYRGSFRVTDERTGQVTANCELVGKAVFDTVTIVDGDSKTWQMHPNRKIMPSRWTVTDPQQRFVMQFEQRILAKLVNPLYRTVLVLLAEDGRELFRLVDPTTNMGDRIFGVFVGEWAILCGDKPMAKLTLLKRSGQTGSGLLGKVRHWLKASDYAIISAAEEHALQAPVGLAMYLVFRELYDPTGG